MLLLLRGGVKGIFVEAGNILHFVEEVDALYPGIKSKPVENGRFRSNLAAAIGGEVARMGMLAQVRETREAHFVSVVGGG